jgi:hypothetical protein
MRKEAVSTGLKVATGKILGWESVDAVEFGRMELTPET